MSNKKDIILELNNAIDEEQSEQLTFDSNNNQELNIEI